MTYKEISKSFLDKAGVTIGDTIKVSKGDIEYEGILLDRSEDAMDSYIVIKLDSGYNVGVNIESATIELIKTGEKPEIGYSGDEIVKDPNKRNVSIISEKRFNHLHRRNSLINHRLCNRSRTPCFYCRRPSKSKPGTSGPCKL